MKKTLSILLLIATVMCIFCGCGGKKNEDKLEIKEDVVKYYEVDEEMQKEIVDFFTKVRDDAKKAETADEKEKIAADISKWSEEFDFSENVTKAGEKLSTLDEKEKEKFSTIAADYSSTATANLRLLAADFNQETYTYDEAFELINGYAKFFFGEEELIPMPKILPFGLEFGMTYDKAKEIHPDLPEAEPSTSTDGYYAGIEIDMENTMSDFFGLGEAGEDYYRPSFGYSFNADEELYELYATVGAEDSTLADSVYNKYVEFCKNIAGFDPEEENNGEEIIASFETDEYGMSVMLSPNDEEYIITMVLHSKDFDFQE